MKPAEAEVRVWAGSQ